MANAANLMLALGGKLVKGKVALWKHLQLKDGTKVYALCLPVDQWVLDPTTNELKLR